MFKEMLPLLEEMRSHVVEQEKGDEAWGPASDNGASTQGEPGESDSQNENPIWDAFDSYISDMVDDLMDKYDIEPDDALDFIFDIADELAEAGELTPVPEDDDPKAVAVWLGKAGSVGFERRVLDAAMNAAQEGEG